MIWLRADRLDQPARGTQWLVIKAIARLGVLVKPNKETRA